jgi:hypothetical protein
VANQIPNPFEAPELWEALKLVGSLGTVTLPNVTVNVRGGGLKEDSAPVAGQDGVERTFLGYDDGDIEVESIADTKAEFNKLRAAVGLYRNRREGKPQVVTGIHPNLQLHGITNVYIVGLSSDDFDPDRGFILRLKLREWQSKTSRTTKGTSKVAGGTAGTGVGAGDTSRPSANRPNTSTAQQAAQNPPSKTAVGPNGWADGSRLARQLLGGN